MTSIKFLREGTTLNINIVSFKRINWKLRCVNELMLFHLSINPLTKLGPLLLILSVFDLHGLIILLENFALLLDHTELFSELLAFVFLLANILVELMNSFLKVINFDFHRFLFFLEFLLNLKDFDIDHFILLNLEINSS